MKDDKTNDELMEGHSYDGIHELDNPLPRWWLYTFYLTIIFSIGYMAYYYIFSAPSLDEELFSEMAQITELQKAAAPQLGAALLDKSFDELIVDSAMMKKAKKKFKRKCSACHGREGQGGIGPNLTDRYWLHSKGDLEGIIKAIREGFPDKGMRAWKDIISDDLQPYLAAFVMKMEGTNPPDPKAPQGDLVER